MPREPFAKALSMESLTFKSPPEVPVNISIVLGRADALLHFSTLGIRSTELLSATSKVDFPPPDILAPVKVKSKHQ